MFKCITIVELQVYNATLIFALFCFDVGSRKQTQIHVLVGHKHFIS